MYPFKKKSNLALSDYFFIDCHKQKQKKTKAKPKNKQKKKQTRRQNGENQKTCMVIHPLVPYSSIRKSASLLPTPVDPSAKPVAPLLLDCTHTDRWWVVDIIYIISHYTTLHYTTLHYTTMHTWLPWAQEKKSHLFQSPTFCLKVCCIPVPSLPSTKSTDLSDGSLHTHTHTHTHTLPTI